MLLPGIAPFSITDSAVQFEAQLDPFDTALHYFDCGHDDTAVSINTFFRQGKWTRNTGVVALRFLLGGARIGYAAVKLSRQPFPWHGSTGSEVDYLAIWMMGLDRGSQGMADPGSTTGKRLADALLAGLQSVAEANSTFGMSLWVRQENARAQAVYGRNGFEVDPRGVFQDSRGIAMLEMRKQFRN